MLSESGKQVRRKRIPYFAPWAIVAAGAGSVHCGTPVRQVIEGTDIVYRPEMDGSGVCKTYANHIETAGFYCSAIISYGHDKNGILQLMRHAVFPMLRMYPNDTHSSLDWNFEGAGIQINGTEQPETVEKIIFDGCIRIYSRCTDIHIVRVLFAARNKPCLIEQLFFENKGRHPARIDLVDRDGEHITPAENGAGFRQYRLTCDIVNGSAVAGPNETIQSSVVYAGCEKGRKVQIDTGSEYESRMAFISEIDSRLIITTPDKILNTMLRYAKIRASESIFETKNGLMHSPGGGGFYAALWTNDQCEYVNPLFGYLGYKTGLEQAVNCYHLYKQYIAPDKALVTSIIAEGDGVWHGAGDRGDSAMYAYGAARFLLSVGDKALAASLVGAIRDCIDFTLSQVNSYGVVRSDSDELENRFKSGKANLSTSCIAYDALLTCACLERELGNDDRARHNSESAEKLKAGIENYFGRKVEGFETYRYCAKEAKLRSWICMPLTVGIFDRAEGTTDALLSKKLRMTEGLVTRSGEKTFWDRSTLYALRGMFNAGQQEKAINLLETYSQARLLGTHIPYCVEAYPEGNQAQLSAESGLYVRIYTEGILGYRPTGFHRFLIKPNLPLKWDSVKLSHFRAHGLEMDIQLKRTPDGYRITISNGFETNMKSGESKEITV